METIVLTHSLNWGDMQALMNTLFTTEERRMILEEAKKELEQTFAEKS